jgi:hypothetical protein
MRLWVLADTCSTVICHYKQNSPQGSSCSGILIMIADCVIYGSLVSGDVEYAPADHVKHNEVVSVSIPTPLPDIRPAIKLAPSVIPRDRSCIPLRYLPMASNDCP